MLERKGSLVSPPPHLLDGRRENMRKNPAEKVPADLFTAGYCCLITNSCLQTALRLSDEKRDKI